MNVTPIIIGKSQSFDTTFHHFNLTFFFPWLPFFLFYRSVFEYIRIYLSNIYLNYSVNKKALNKILQARDAINHGLLLNRWGNIQIGAKVNWR